MNLLAALQTFELPRWWRIVVIAAGALVLCSCRAPLGNVGQIGQPSEPVVQDAVVPANHQAPVLHAPGLQSGARRDAPCPTCPTCPPPAHGVGYGHGMGHGQAFVVPHGAGYAEFPPQSPQLSDIRPSDEYICDGGDQERPTKIGPDFMVYGLDVEDTVAHYDTLDGRRLVEATNKVCIYAPRFAAVRQVRGLRQHEQHDFIGRVHQPVAATLQEESQLAAQFNQPLQPVAQIGAKQATIFRERNMGVGLDNAQRLIDVGGRQGLLIPFRVLETGVYDQAEKAELAAAIDAAITWTHDLGVNVLIGNQRLAIDTHDTRLGQTYVSEHEGTPQVRIIKVASAKEAQPGDVVEFTLRFDNIGDELVGNVTVIDNLTTRLEYLPESQTCSVEAAFFVEPNEAQSLALRWEIIEPLAPGKGGVITFKCRVR